MAISKGRNEIQASIEDKAAMLTCLAQEINLYFSNSCYKVSNRIENIRNNNKKEDPDVLSSMLASDYQLLYWYEELTNQTMQLFIPKIYSYAEKHIEGLLTRISLTMKQARKQYDNEFKDTKGISDIEKGCYMLCRNADLSYEEIMSKWAEFEELHSIRNSIAHRYKEANADINIDYITTHIKNAKVLLSTLELLTR